MKNILLTANGFENRNIGKKFMEILDKKPSQIKVIFVPTAAINPGAIEVLPKCMHDLLDLGIPADNIKVYDLHYKMEYNELIDYDAIYFCGGNTEYLLKRINETGFKTPLIEFIENGGVYIGVSAGSIISAKNYPDNLGYLNCKLDVHGKEGINTGKFQPNDYTHIQLPDLKAILIQGNNYEIID
ncbi:MAG: Type 1 glutamine amidotransferase-like domain-containing protein [Oscillospiraceae bacterium]|jgi:peptidase E|nr:Type 1 glutamine amidotransferase-like domain-containing protein [Oscillospiraceae bacterium]